MLISQNQGVACVFKVAQVPVSRLQRFQLYRRHYKPKFHNEVKQTQRDRFISDINISTFVLSNFLFKYYNLPSFIQ